MSGARLILAGAALAAGAGVVADAADAQTRGSFSADASATAGWSANPFTAQGDDTGAGVVTFDLAPRYQIATPHSTLTIAGDANLQQYLSRYGHNLSFAGSVDHQGRPSERVTTHARIDLSSAVLGAFNSYLPLAGGIAPGTTAVGTSVIPGTAAGTGVAPGTGIAGAGIDTGLVPAAAVNPLVGYPDVGLYGLRNRRRSFRGNGDVGYTASARDSFSVGVFGEVTRYDGLGANDYDAYGGSLGYQRRLSSRLTLGVTGSAANYSYHSFFPSTQNYSIQATAAAQLNQRWSLNGALGVSFVGGGGGGSTSATSLSGNANLCRVGAHSSLCLQAARAVSPTGYAGTQYVTTVGASWNRQLDERQSVSLGANYSKVGGGTLSTIGGLPLQSEYVQAVAGYNRRLNGRLRLLASANYRELLSSNIGRSADYGGQVGLSYRFGDQR